MTFVNHLKDVDAQNLFLEVSYGKRYITGDLAKSIVSGSSPTHQITIQQMLGRGPWDGIEGAWYRGLNLPPSSYKFYPGIMSPGMGDSTQGQDPVFNTDTPHSNVAWLSAELPVGVGEFDTKNSPPQSFTGIFRTMKCQDYDAFGDPDGGVIYSTNAALQVADLILRIGRRSPSRIDWGAWCAWRDFLAGDLSYDYTIIPGLDGFGLQGEYYDGTAFDTLKTTRIDPTIEFVSSSGAPSVHISSPTSFSVRWEGYIRAKYSETYTFSLTHNDGGKLWIDDLETPLIDEWASTGTHTDTIALTAGQLYPIKIEWKNAASTSEMRLQWQSASQSLEVPPYKVLYPKTVDRPRYETHPFFKQPTRLDDAVRTILNLCNSGYQEVNGKLRFFCYEQLLKNEFWFNEDNIIDGSMVIKPRDPLLVRNSWTCKFRDVDSQYLEQALAPPIIERPALIEAAGRKIDGEAIDLFTCSRHQAYRTLDWRVRLLTDPKWGVEFTGTADTFPVLSGDRVFVDLNPLSLTRRDALVIDAGDASAEETADERNFKLVEFIGASIYPPVLTSIVWSGVADEVTGTFYVNGGTGTVRIMRKPGRISEGGAYSEISTLTADDTVFVDDSISETGWYTYKLTQDDASSESNLLEAFADMSDTATISGISFDSPNNEIELVIANNGGTGNIQIHHRLNGGGWTQRGEVSSDTTGFADEVFANGTYEYKLTQTGVTGESGIQAITVTVSAQAPSDLEITNEYCSGGSLWVDLAWVNNGVGGNPTIRRKKGGGSWTNIATLPTDTTTFSAEILFTGKGTYYFQAGNSNVVGYSNQVGTYDDGVC